jgi:hypothetical protein
MDATHANAELFAALSLAQCEVENVTKNAINPAFKGEGKKEGSRYADLSEVLATARPVYSRHGVSLIQSGNLIGDQVVVTSILAHKSGGYITAEASCIPSRRDPQGVGAAITYLRRYSAAALFCIAQEDDDGNAASGRADQTQSAPKPTAKKQKTSEQPEAWTPPPALEADAAACKSKSAWNSLYNQFAPYAASLDADAKKAAWSWLVGKAKASGYRWDKDGSLFEPIAQAPDFLA